MDVWLRGTDQTNIYELEPRAVTELEINMHQNVKETLKGMKAKEPKTPISAKIRAAAIVLAMVARELPRFLITRVIIKRRIGNGISGQVFP